MSPVTSQRLPFSISQRWLWLAAVLVLAGIAAASHQRWLPAALAWLEARRGAAGPAEGKSAGADSHAGHDHSADAHAGHDEANSLELSEQARKNIGLKTAKIVLQSFQRTIAVPGIVVERPGRSTVEVTAPLTGVVTRIHRILGEAVEAGQPLFELRLTHEELVQAQGDFLRTIEELDVIAQEVKRLERVSDGVVAGKSLLERKYEQQRQQAVMRAQQQALLLHGLSSEQVDRILTDRTLLQFMVVAAASHEEAMPPAGLNSPMQPGYQLQSLKVGRGQHVTAGDTLAVLADHAELFIEGNAFERDIPEINRAVETSARVTGVQEMNGGKPLTIPGLEIVYLSGEVDADSRAVHFYVRLPNTLLRDTTTADGHRFVHWRFKPGQRMQLLVPVETWEACIVLPVEAVAQDGVETFVFQANGDHFDRRAVHVEYRDSLWAVIANDGSIFPRDTVAMSGAQQMQVALKNKAGGPIDPHAGHSH